MCRPSQANVDGDGDDALARGTWMQVLEQAKKNKFPNSSTRLT